MLRGCFVTDHITGSGIDEWMICVAKHLHSKDEKRDVRIPVIYHYGSNPPRSTKLRMIEAGLTTITISQERMPDFGVFDFVCCHTPPIKQLVEAVKTGQKTENKRIHIVGVEHFVKPREIGRRLWCDSPDIRSMLCVSLDSVANLPHINRSQRCLVVKNGFDPDKVCSPGSYLQSGSLKKKLNIPEEAKVITFVGSMYPSKRPVEAFEGVIEYSKKNPNLPLAFIACGDGPQRLNLIQSAERIKGKLSFHLLSDPDLREVYHDTNVFIQLSDSESNSFALNEAIASGCQIVCTHTGSPRHFTNYGRSGSTWPFVSNVEDKEEVAAAIENALHGVFSSFVRDMYQDLMITNRVWTTTIENWFREVCRA